MISENLQILYEDNHIIAVYKPGGVLVQGDISGDISLMDLIKQYIKDTYKKPGNVFLGLVHRLDRPVAGVVVLAKTSKGASRLSAQFRSRSITKIYWAQVYGQIDPKEGTLTSYLMRETKGARLAKEGEPGARNAVLSYKTLHVKGGKSLLEIILHTGRKHQIRAQIAGAGHPIVGDVKYGAPSALADGTIRLLAKSLTFKHPTRDEIITVESPEPDWDF
jgi:23S rRNA pseudouridine1911/1915/1917 synthase